MASELRWSAEALRDIEEIAEFIARDSDRYAAVVVDKAFELAERIRRQPLAGSSPKSGTKGSGSAGSTATA